MKSCETCLNEHDGTFASGRFCCLRCSKSFSTKATRKDVNLRVSAALRKKILYCVICQKVLYRTDGDTYKHCREHRNIQGKDIPFNLLKNDKSRKSRLVRERGWRCEHPDCGIEIWLKQKAPIQLDHINGDVTDNRKENLRLLCANCHALTSTFCGKNIGRYETVRTRSRKNMRP